MMKRIPFALALLASIAFTVLGVVKLVQASKQLAKYSIYSEKGRDRTFTTADISLEPGHTYRVRVSCSDEEKSRRAECEVKAELRLGGKLLTFERAHDTEDYSEEDSYVRASAFFQKDLTVDAPKTFSLRVDLEEGDDWEIDLYRDVPKDVDAVGKDAFIWLFSGITLFVLSVIAILVDLARVVFTAEKQKG